jgi:hypothetical protein
MDATTYTGNGTGQSIVNSGAMQPDFVWFKRRSASENHWLVDAIRGVSKGLYSNLTDAEGTQATCVTSFNSNGFTVGADAAGFTNINGQTYVAWQWKAGGSSSSNTAGSITSTVSVNATAGFSVVTYTCQASGTGTVGHGLGVAPAMIIFKPRTKATQWSVYHKSLAAGQYLALNTTAAQSNSLNIFTTTLPTSTVFSMGTSVAGDGSSIAYCWAEISGFSRFGSYTGNGSTNGPFVFTNFRPKFVMVKLSSASGSSWTLLDTSRNPINVSDTILRPDSSGAEFVSGNNTMDILSNGFKLRATWGDVNTNGATYIFMAFAEVPTKFANAR